MKNKIVLSFLIILFGIFNPSFAIDDSSYMSLDEYATFFELGIVDDVQFDEEVIQDEPFVPKLKEKFNLEKGDVIGVEEEPIKLQIEKEAFLEPYKEVFIEPDSKYNILETNKFSLFSDGSKEQSNYMTNYFKSTINASYDFNNKFSLYAGHETWYVNPNASLGARKFFFNPRYNLTDSFYIDYAGKYNHSSKYIEQEVGLNFKPKKLNDAAKFGLKATSITNDNKQIQTQRLKFETDWYLY